MTELVGSLASWGVSLPHDPATTDMELSPQRRHHHSAASDEFTDPIATPSQLELFDLMLELPPIADAFELDRAVPEPHPLSVEMLELAARARAARRDTWIARTEFRRVAGSRKRLLRQLLRGSPGTPGTPENPVPEIVPAPAVANPPPVT
jgi:hypothetical protein